METVTFVQKGSGRTCKIPVEEVRTYIKEKEMADTKQKTNHTEVFQKKAITMRVAGSSLEAIAAELGLTVPEIRLLLALPRV